MAFKWAVYHREGRCSGWVEYPKLSFQEFICHPDGRLGLDRPDAIPERAKVEMQTHCWNNCRTQRWRRPGAIGLRGCGYGRQR